MCLFFVPASPSLHTTHVCNAATLLASLSHGRSHACALVPSSATHTTMPYLTVTPRQARVPTWPRGRAMHLAGGGSRWRGGGGGRAWVRISIIDEVLSQIFIRHASIDLSFKATRKISKTLASSARMIPHNFQSHNWPFSTQVD